MRNYLYVSPSGDGWHNLAMDEWILDHLDGDDLLLHFYVNENAVILGRNQNPWRECDLEAMERDGVQLVRRVTGGGAVYHDTGNLNFSFITGQERYDVQAQLELILRAVRSLGIDCGFSGRNDLLAGGRKFSGNAFCRRGQNCQHHGTLLVDTALDRLRRYLRPDPRKLEAKGVASVRSRVCDLREFRPELTVEALREALKAAFCESFGPYEIWMPSAAEGLARYEERHRSWDWRMGKTPRFDLSLDRHFPWGGVELRLRLDKGRIAGLDVFSDALDAALPEHLREILLGWPLDAAADALRRAADPKLCELGDWLAGEKLG